MEETKKINHHGHIREVTTNDGGKKPGQGGSDKDNNLNNDTIKALQIIDYFDFAFQTELDETEGRPTPKIAFGDLDLYDNSEEKRERKLKIMNGCIFFSRNIKPVIIIIFVLIYWGSGLIRANQIE